MWGGCWEWPSPASPGVLCHLWLPTACTCLIFPIGWAPALSGSALPFLPAHPYFPNLLTINQSMFLEPPLGARHERGVGGTPVVNGCPPGLTAWLGRPEPDISAHACTHTLNNTIQLATPFQFITHICTHHLTSLKVGWVLSCSPDRETGSEKSGDSLEEPPRGC